jgi:hypothetical protein
MFLKNGQPIDGFVWVEYSFDGSGTPGTMVQTQPANATADQLAAMGITVQADPPSSPPPAPVPQIISDRQFFQQLAIQNVITLDEALAAIGPGTIPASLSTLIGKLPLDQQFAAKMLISGATQFDRNHPLVATLAAAFGWNSAQTDFLWTSASQL